MEVGTLVDSSILSSENSANDVPPCAQPQMRQDHHKLPTSVVVFIQSESRVEESLKPWCTFLIRTYVPPNARQE